MSKRISILRELIRQVNDPVIEQLTLTNLLYVVLKAFVHSNKYNSIDRHLLKLLLEEIQDMIREILYVANHVKIWFYLTLLEVELAERVPDDLYNLKQLGKLFSSSIQSLKLEKSLQRTQTLELQRLSEKDQKSKHVVIVLHGFLN
jgi:hypothetical protein